MSNTLPGVFLNKLAQLSLDALVTKGVPLSGWVTDFSADAKPAGEVVTTRFASAVTTSDFSSGKSSTAATLTKRDITLSSYRGARLSFTDLEMSYTDRKLSELFVEPAVAALIEDVMTSLLGLVTNSNGYTASVTKTAAQFDADVMADLAEALTTAKVSDSPRTALLKPTYYAGLTKDNAIQAAYAYGSDSAIRENKVPRVHGFDVVQYNGTIPSNSENLTGLVGHRSALCIAARGVAHPPDGTWYGNIKDIVEPNSGLPIQLREYYDGSALVYEWTINYGVAIGIPTAAVRIKSA